MGSSLLDAPAPDWSAHSSFWLARLLLFPFRYARCVTAVRCQWLDTKRVDGGFAMRRKVPASTLRTIWMPVLLSLVLLPAGLGNWNPSIAAPSAAPSAPSAENLKVMKTGLGSGTVASGAGDILCGADCDETYGSAVSVTLTATPDAGSTFAGWSGDCSGAATTCTVTMSAARSVRAQFNLLTAIPTITDFTAAGIESYLAANPIVNSPARFVAALPREFRQNWILMSRSESLQTGTADSPRILLPSADARFVFTIGMTEHSSYPGSHHNAIEYMQWDAADKNFRFHEIVLDAIPAMGGIPPRSRGVSIDDARCSKCHSTRNVLNRSASPGTDGVPPRTVQVKNKPNWDSYDSWGGMLPFNRDRIYQGSVEARLKGAGMHWQRGHVDAMLALRNLLCNDRWEQEWPHIKARLVTQAQHRRFPACQKRLETLQMQEQAAALAAQHAQFVALHPEWLADPQPAQPPDPPPASTPKSAKPARDHPWRHSPIGKARSKQFPKS